MSAMVLPDAPARLAALVDHQRTLLIEAGAGSGKTALMAGRVAILLTAGTDPAEIVAITFTEAAASELLERIERFVEHLLNDEIPLELRAALPNGLASTQRVALRKAALTLDELVCTTIHGFCQQLVRPYPVELGIDPGAAIIDPAAAALASQDLMDAWLSARFGRDRSAEGLGRIPAMSPSPAGEDYFAEMLHAAPDATLKLIRETADFLKHHRTATASAETPDLSTLTNLAVTITDFAAWYNGCGVVEDSTDELLTDLARVANVARDAAAGPLDARQIVSLLGHQPPTACLSEQHAFKQWRRKGKWKDAAKLSGISAAGGEQLSNQGEERYHACGAAYEKFCATLGLISFQRFVAEFEAFKDIYAHYKRDAALLDFDDLLHHARDLLRNCEPVRQSLAARYPRILVDEFQDTDPLQAEILWRLAGEGPAEVSWHQRQIRPGALFLVGDPKQAIYRFRGADVATYLLAKEALAAADPSAIMEISANFRSQAPILDFVNEHFAGMLDVTQGQPGFAALAAVRPAGDQPAVMTFDILVEDRHRGSRGLDVNALRAEEARLVADIVERMVGAFPIWDKAASTYRPARAGDIALLAPTGTSLWIYERALERRGIPIATQAGKGFFRRQEVQDLIAVARAIADRRDTLAFGALIRGPLIGLTEEEIADQILVLSGDSPKTEFLHLWTPAEKIGHPILKQTLVILQNLARKARSTTPHQLMAEAVEELKVRPILKARYQQGTERALANVDLFLEMARPYAVRGMADFAGAMRKLWDDAESQAEGRPDAESDSLSIVTIHSAKGLEWPIVIPINSMTGLGSRHQFLHRRQDDTVHFTVLGYASPDYETVKQAESDEQERERVRLWYVALTRARDLLLLPKQSERADTDWFSLLNLTLDGLPVFDGSGLKGKARAAPPLSPNRQDLPTWQREAARIAAATRTILWHQPSLHEGAVPVAVEEQPIYASPEAVADQPPVLERPDIQGGLTRGLLLHKMIEEVLNGETAESEAALTLRATQLLAQLGMPDAPRPADGPSSSELAASVLRGLKLPEVDALRPRLLSEVPVYSGLAEGNSMTLTAGIADAVAVDAAGKITDVIDWKSDVAPEATMIALYRQQVQDYLRATGAASGLIVFLTTGQVVKVAGG